VITLNYTAFGDQVRGAQHVKNKSKCQDKFKIEKIDDALIIAVADGHGSSKCKYSDEGAQLAVNVFCDIIASLVKQHSGRMDELYSYLSRNKAESLPKKIVQVWKDTVEKNHQKKSNEVEIDLTFYGTTLLGFLITESFCFALQLGDGDILCVNSGGQTTPFIETDKILGTETYSISSEKAWENVIIEMRNQATDEFPVLFIISTDGFANSFVSDEEFMKTGADYLELLKEYGENEIKDNLKNWLNETTQNGSGDDITLVLIYDKMRIRLWEKFFWPDCEGSYW
jgi:serine/threonine protein phosphatase PrpC